MQSVLDLLHGFLAENNVEYRVVEHEVTPTSEDSARARGEPLRIGGKALVMKVGDALYLFVLPADRKFDSSGVKKRMKVKKMRFATKEELFELTGLVPGSVPPFGPPILSLPLIVDEALKENDRIAFNAGSLTTSFVLAMDDYLQLAKPEFRVLS